MKKITLFCDGSSLGNQYSNSYGGWCAILRYKTFDKILSGNEANTTNNRMELTAVIEGLKALKEPCDITIVSDSKYVCDGISAWLDNWTKKNFKNVKNVELWQAYLRYAKNHKITTRWIKGHDGHIENEKCDSIARAEALILKDSTKGKI